MIASVILKHQHLKMGADMNTTFLLKYKTIGSLFQNVYLKPKII